MEESLLNLINHTWTSPALDALMAAMSSLKFWAIPLIILIAAVAIYGRFRARAMLIVLAITILISDNLVGDTVKHLVGRPRPCETLAGVRIVTLNLTNPLHHLAVTFSGGQKKSSEPWVRITLSHPNPGILRGLSFPSDHTLNNFCAAMVLTFFYRRYGWLCFIPASLVAYSRIYVGAHWPSDIAISIVIAVGLSLILMALYEYLWRAFGPRFLPQTSARHRSLWAMP